MVAAAIPDRHEQRGSARHMRTRSLGRSGLVVSEIGFGCWGIGGLVAGASYGRTDDRTSLSALQRALDRGITFFDTADSYGDGHSEELLGQAFGNRRDQVVIATKAGHPDFRRPPDFSPPQLRRSAEGSLRRLRRERIDLLQLHNPTIDLLRQQPEILETLEALRREGKIGAFGVSTKAPAEAVLAIREFAIPVVQVNFNLVDHRALESGLLELAASTQTGVIGRTPLAFGFLSGMLGADTRFPEGDHRATWPAEQIQRWAGAARAFVGSIAARERQSLSQIALRFCLSYKEVGTIIPGMLRPEEVDENAAASDQGPLAPADLAAIRDVYSRSEFAVARPKSRAPVAARSRVMVTGTTAVLGSAILDMADQWPDSELVTAPYDALDLTDAAATEAFVRQHRISHILHLAAISGGVELTRKYPARILRENVIMTFSVLDAAVACGVKKVVMTLSSGAYPVHVPQPNVETQLHDGPPHDSAFSYAYAKRLIDPAIRAYRAEHGLNVVGLIPSGIFGENDNFNEADCTWIAGLIRRFCEWTPERGDLLIWGDGSPVRKITDARDMARAFMWGLAKYDEPLPLNVGSGEPRTIGEVAYLLADVAGVPRDRIRFDETRARGIDRRITSNARFVSLSGLAYTPLRASLERVVAWYKRTLRERPEAIRREPRIRPR
jgi:aryl-alcohol dehydrogenase-like predicted oxidoreductase/nucleoside-diphosphate-sugar epimerase